VARIGAKGEMTPKKKTAEVKKKWGNGNSTVIKMMDGTKRQTTEQKYGDYGDGGKNVGSSVNQTVPGLVPTPQSLS